MIRRLIISVLIAVAALGLLSSTALEANMTAAANITGIAAAALPAVALLTATGYSLGRLGRAAARGSWRLVRRTIRRIDR